MNKLSGDKNADMLILMKLNDHELSKVCEVNKYIHGICQNRDFWNMRIRMLLNVSENELHELRRYLHMDGKELYVYLVSIWKYHHMLILFLLKYQSFINEVIEKSIMETLPKYINKEQLIYYLRGKIPKLILEDKILTIDMEAGFRSTAFYSHRLNVPTAIIDMKFPYPENMISFLDKYIKENIRK